MNRPAVDHDPALPDLAMIHGWGLHAGIWDGSVSRLAGRARPATLDLPGHGYQQQCPEHYGLEELAAELVGRCPSPAIWLGWSLGAMVAMTVALRFPQRVRALVLVSATPRFVSGAGWDHGLPSDELYGFSSSLRNDFEGTLQRFLALQVPRNDEGRRTLRDLRHQMSRRPAPREPALAGGLRILQGTDLRAQAAGIRVPTLLLHGDRDRLVPAAASRELAGLIPAAQRIVIAGAGHAPFLSHPDRFAGAVGEFLERFSDPVRLS